MRLIRHMRYEEEPLCMKGLRWLCEYLCWVLPSRPRVMYEIGTYAGEAAEVFARYFDKVDCVDIFGFSYSSGDYRSTEWSSVEESFDERARLSGGIIAKHKGWSVDIAHEVIDESLDFVYIDADHKYDSVQEDLKAWEPKVKSGGFIGGHDFDCRHPDVAKAVTECFPNSALQGENLFNFHTTDTIRIFPDTSWLVRKEGNRLGLDSYSGFPK